jgi:hypothetical protein
MPMFSGAGALLADGGADLFGHRQRLARRAQGVVLAAGEDPRPRQGIDDMRLVGLGNRRKAHDVPILLRQHVANQIGPRVKPEGKLSCSRWA